MQGFRVMARPILDEVLGFRPDFIEHQPVRDLSRDGFGVQRGLDECGQLIRVGGSGTELAVENLVHEGGSQSQVEVPFGAEAPEPLTGFGRDADRKRYTVQHKDTQQHIKQRSGHKATRRHTYPPSARKGARWPSRQGSLWRERPPKTGGGKW